MLSQPPRSFTRSPYDAALPLAGDERRDAEVRFDDLVEPLRVDGRVDARE
jgi:hypothetical protein